MCVVCVDCGRKGGTGDANIDVSVGSVFVGCDDVKAWIAAIGGSVGDDNFFGWHVPSVGVDDGNQSVADAIVPTNDMSSNFAAGGMSSVRVLSSDAGLVGAFVFAVSACRRKVGRVQTKASGGFEFLILHVT